MIPRETIDKLNELPILSVASKLGINVNKKMALCFIHDDYHPSLHFNTGKNTWKCYVCNKGGGVINLVMEKLEIGFVDACKWLADEFTIIIPEDDGYRKQFKKKTVKTVVKQKTSPQIVIDMELYVVMPEGQVSGISLN